ncbi:MAG: penicillin-binding protein [Acidobacteriota bacterium]|nr:penicillin-binding protein [Acidobacteriota bacterium]
MTPDSPASLPLSRGGRARGTGRGGRGVRVRAALAVALNIALAPWLWFFALNQVFPFPWENLERPPAVVVMDRTGAPLRFFLPADERWRFPVKLSDLPPELPRALVASEDRWFYRHPGVNPVAIVRAAWSNLWAGEVVSGASTIPMQIARMAVPGPRTISSKLRESFRAIQLERRFSKDELLEIYLNLTPYGGNVEGIGTAAWFYFGKEPDQLSLGEIALLTALPRSPGRYDPTLHPKAAQEARDRVLAQLTDRGVFPREEIENARQVPVPRTRRKPPIAAPHFSEQVKALLPGEPRIRTTIDRRLQTIAEEQVVHRIRELRDQGIGNAAVVVIENETHAVRALVGSAGFQETYFKGQVNGALARRSPGSTLKPFLYALALDQGRVLPDSYLLDIPTDFSGYVAENYDDQYRGRVTVREALIQSLNACAVRLLSEVGLKDYHQLLKDGGLATLDRPYQHYGLPLVLGAGEVTLLDLTNLYASLAGGGEHRDYQIIEGEKSSPPAQLFSPEAAHLITEILTDVRRPDLPESWDLSVGAPGVAWKTGTSYGHRDAWAVGFSQRFTIGVWVGNFDGRPRKGISGSQHAGPLLFDLFRAVDPGGGNPGKSTDWTKRIQDLDQIELCAESHELPGPFCPMRMKATYLPGRSHLVQCTYHRRALVDSETGELLSGDCVRERPHELRSFTVFPAELVAWWRAQGSPVPEPPRFSSACQGIPAGDPPRIVSPAAATPYRVRRDTPPEYQRIPLIAQASAEASRLFWYQDGMLVASTSPGENHFLPSLPGEHRLVVTDDLGRSDGVVYKVE